MSMKSVGLATIGATAGFMAGNYLYNLDKEANKYKEVSVPFYTVRKVADDISKETKKMVDDIKAKCQSKKEQVHEMTDEEVVEELQQNCTVINEGTVEETKSEQPVIDTQVIDGIAVPVDGEGNPINKLEEVQEEQNVETTEVKSEETKVVGNTEEAIIPQFTVVDQVPVNKEEAKSEPEKPEKKVSEKATTKGSKAKAENKK